MSFRGYPLETAPAGMCDNCCEQVDEYHCRSARPFREHVLRVPLLPRPRSWSVPQTDYPYSSYAVILLCSVCVASARGGPSIPLDHVSGHHALNAWLFDNYGGWVPRNYRLEDACTRCRQPHSHMLQTIQPGYRLCVACFIEEERLPRT